MSILAKAAVVVSLCAVWKADKKDGEELIRFLEAEAGNVGMLEPMMGEVLGEEAFEFLDEGISSGINNTKASFIPRPVCRLPSTLINVLESMRNGFSG